MGGSVFAAGSAPLFTPRMPREVYSLVKARCHAALREHYLCVASPIDGPAKNDFGDVDILLAWPMKPLSGRDETLAEIANALEATQAKVEKGKDISGHFAIPWPSQLSVTQYKLAQEASGKPEAPSQNSTQLHTEEKTGGGVLQCNSQDDGNERPASHQQDRFIQVDVRVCDTFDYFQWMLFKHAHGDVWNLLGTTARPYGLSIDESALWLRIPEIETFHRNRSKVFLTDEPAEILDFLGLPIGEYWSKCFDSLDAMYEYVALCKLFWVKPLDPKDEGTEAEQDRYRLKANDRKRMNQRSGFRRWVDEFKPRCRREGRFLTQPTTREAVTKEAFDRFHVQGEFEARRREFLMERHREKTWKLIKEEIPEADPHDQRSMLYRSVLVKALKRIILDNDSQYGILPRSTIKDDDGYFVPSKVIEFITQNKDSVGKVALDQHFAQCTEHLKRKAEKEAKRDNDTRPVPLNGSSAP